MDTIIREQHNLIEDLIFKLAITQQSLKETRFWLSQYKEKYREQNRQLAALGMKPTRSLCQQDWDLLEDEQRRWRDHVYTQLDALRG